jgi:hypothetical protein
MGPLNRVIATNAGVRSDDRFSGPWPSFDDGRGLVTCSSFENGHLCVSV